MATIIDGNGAISVEGTSTTQGRLRLYEDTDNGTNYLELQAASSIATNLTLTLPGADGSSGQVLQTDGAGTLSFASVSFTSPVSVTANSSVGAELRLPEATVNGTQYAAIKASDSLTTNTTCTLPTTNSTLGYLNLPAVGTKTSSYTLTTSDVGKYVQVGANGSITVPNATFSEGDVVVIVNNTTNNATITCSITSAYIAGTDTVKSSATLATRGLCTIVFLAANSCVMSGNLT